MFLALFKLVLLAALNCLLVATYGLIGIGVAMAIANVVYCGALFVFVMRHRAFQTAAASSVAPVSYELYRPREIVPKTT
jgi:hypothetical protein